MTPHYAWNMDIYTIFYTRDVGCAVVERDYMKLVKITNSVLHSNLTNIDIYHM